MTGHDRDQSERLTRARLIDPKLKSCGWSVVPFELDHFGTQARLLGHR